MAITTVLFDLDGTLLPMDQDDFIRAYFGALAKTAAPYGYDAQALIDAVWAGTAAMVKNDSAQTNEAVFWRTAGQRIKTLPADKPIFDRFYETEFQTAQSVCGFNPDAAKTVHLAKKLGFRVALATNPIFPATATRSRIGWAGLTPEEFELFTTYENTSCCKPNPDYFADVARRLGVKPEQCLMVGNDASEDLAAAKCGMDVFLLTDCLICKDDAILQSVSHGGFPDLQAYLRKLAA